MENRGHDVFLRHQVTDWGPAGCGGHRAVVGRGAAQVPEGGGALVNPPGGAGFARRPPQRLLAAPQQEGCGSRAVPCASLWAAGGSSLARRVTHLAPAPSPRAPMEGNSEAMACGERAPAVPLAVPPSCLPSAGSPSPALWKAAAGERREPRPGAPQIMRCLCGDCERSAPDNRLLFSCLFSCVRTACAAGSRGSWSTPSPALTPKLRAKSSRGCWWGWERRAPEAPRGFVQLWPVLAERRFWCCPREMGCSAPAQQLLLPGDEKIHLLSMTQLFGGRICTPGGLHLVPVEPQPAPRAWLLVRGGPGGCASVFSSVNLLCVCDPLSIC